MSTKQDGNDRALAELTSMLGGFSTDELGRLVENFELVRAVAAGELVGQATHFQTFFEHYGKVTFQELMADHREDFSRWYIEVGVDTFLPLSRHYPVSAPLELRSLWPLEHVKWFVLVSANH